MSSVSFARRLEPLVLERKTGEVAEVEDDVNYTKRPARA